MRQRWLVLLGGIFMMTGVWAQKNVSLASQVTYGPDLSDVWGYTDTASGNEYALVGLYSGVSIVDISIPSSPNQLFQRSGPNSTWRDIKIWKDYAYVVNESDSGLLIMDLTNLPSSLSTYRWDTLGYQTAHDIFIDDSGYAYIMGANASSGDRTLIVDLSSPLNPQLVGTYTANYVHDGFVRNDTFWAAEIYQGWFAAIGVSDKSNPQVLATHPTPNQTSHNIWISDDGNYAFTTDEKNDAYVAAYDVSDLNNITEVDRYQSGHSQKSAPHNTFYKNGYLVTSYYKDGVTIVDAHRPQNLVEVGYYDTSPLSGSGFSGCWGVYPYFSSGTMIASDVEEGLFVLTPTYERACYLEGTVTDSSDSSPLSGVKVQVDTVTTASTDLNGNYKTGVIDSGQYDITFSKYGYFSKTISNEQLDKGVVDTLHVELVPKSPFTLGGTVREVADSNIVPYAHVQITTLDTSFMTTADQNGDFTFSSLYQDSFRVYTGKWGYQTKAVEDYFSPSNSSDTIYLDAGIYDDFLFDFGWQTSGTTGAGAWERGDPNGTSYFGYQIQPGNDVPGDYGESAYVTGNDPNASYNQDDIDNGIVRLKSPGFNLISADSVTIEYAWWYVTFSGTTDDELQTLLLNGNDTLVLQQTSVDSADTMWQQTKRVVYDSQFSFTNNMNLVFVASDTGDQNVVEAGIDELKVTGASLSPPVAQFYFQVLNNLNVSFQDASLNAPTSWSWTFGDGQSGAGDTVTHQYSSEGDYEVCLAVANQVGSDTTCDTITVQSTGLSSSLSLSTISMSPNPFQRQLEIQYNLSRNSQAPYIQIYNILGEQVAHFSLEQSQGTIRWGETSKTGLYFVTLYDGQQRLTRKIMKQ